MGILGLAGGNTLWGFQMAWYMVLLGLAVAMFLLDRASLTWLVLAGAMAAAVVGSFSSLQGLLIWPTGLVLLYLRRRSWRIMAVWIVSAIVTGAIYLYHYHANVGFSNPSYLVTHPFSATSFFLFSIGNNITGQEVANPNSCRPHPGNAHCGGRPLAGHHLRFPP